MKLDFLKIFVVPTNNPIVYNWKIAGEAGYGIMNTGGPIFAKTLVRMGFFTFIYSEYPSLIRGGHNSMQVSVDDKEISASYGTIDQLVALNANACVWHMGEMSRGGVIIYDPDTVKFKDDGSVDNKWIPFLTGMHSVERARQTVIPRKDVQLIPVPFERIAQEIGGSKIMRNVVSVGAALALFEEKVKKIDRYSRLEFLPMVKEVLADMFKEKGEKVVEPNIRVVEEGYKVIKSKIQNPNAKQ